MPVVQDGLVNVPGLFFAEIRLVFLLGFVLVAAAIDVRTHRIPNWLVASGIVVGLGWQLIQLAPVGGGLVWALEGVLVGGAMLLPMYLLRAMGAGDVKLMAMVGAYLGPMGAFSAALMSIVAGGVLALVVAATNGALGRLLGNIKFMIYNSAAGAMGGGRTPISQPARSAGNMPYGVAIAAGTIAYVATHRGVEVLF